MLSLPEGVAGAARLQWGDFLRGARPEHGRDKILIRKPGQGGWIYLLQFSDLIGVQVDFDCSPIGEEASCPQRQQVMPRGKPARSLEYVVSNLTLAGIDDDAVQLSQGLMAGAHNQNVV